MISTWVWAFFYSFGVHIIGRSAHLKWWTGFGIWITGLALMRLIVEEKK